MLALSYLISLLLVAVEIPLMHPECVALLSEKLCVFTWSGVGHGKCFAMVYIL